MESYLECEDIIKIYPQKTKVKKATLRGLHFTIHEGEFISILGPSGCGKTTLLLIIAGLLEPSAGSVSLEGNVVNDLSSKEKLHLYRKNIGLMFQNPQENVIWDLCVFDNILLPMTLISSDDKKKSKKERVLEIIKQLDLANNVSKKPSKLSGGELQRLGIGVAFANDPNLLILDEPTSQLDTRNAIQIVRYLKSLCTQHNKTIIMVTHDLRLVRLTDRVFLMKDGLLHELKMNERKEIIKGDSNDTN